MDSGRQHPPAICEACGHVFPASEFMALGPDCRGITISGQITRCPDCGGKARVGDGLYSATAKDILLLSGPPLTRAMMERLATVAKNAREKALAADDIIAEVAEISPEFATKLAHYSLPAWLLIVLLIWMVKSVQLSFEVDINKLIDQAHHLWKGEDPNFHEGGTPIPDPDFEAAKPDAEHQPFIPDYTLTAATPAAKLNRLARRREGRPPRRTRR